MSPAQLQKLLTEVANGGLSIADALLRLRSLPFEQLPFANGTYDMVLSQFGHIFAPRPDVAIAEMLRVLKSGGTVAFSTWPPELCIGRLFALTGRYLPPPPPGVAPPNLWGDPNVVRERLGAAVTQLAFDRGTIFVSALSLQHYRDMVERTAGPMVTLVEWLGATDPAKLAQFRREFDALTAEYFDDNLVRQDYLMTRAVKY